MPLALRSQNFYLKSEVHTELSSLDIDFQNNQIEYLLKMLVLVI